MERVMKLTKDFNSMQNYMNRMDFINETMLNSQ